MKKFESLPRRRSGISLRELVALLIVALAGRELVAQPFVYGLNAGGKLSFNGTVLNGLPTGAAPEQRWEDLVVRGADRYTLRRDGKVFKNGEKFQELDFLAAFPREWISMALTSTDVVVALRQDGVFASGGQSVATLPTADGDNLFAFRQVLVSGEDTFSLRADGAVFRNDEQIPVFRFIGGNGVSGFPDGQSVETVWLSIAVDPLDGELYALRTDGKIFKGNGSESEVATLPFPPIPEAVAPGHIYFDLAFTANGNWHALRANGEVFAEGDVISPIVDLPGEGAESGDVFVDMATNGNNFWVIRTDGRVYRNTDGVERLKLANDGYVRVAVGNEAPDLSKIKDEKPVAALYSFKAVEGDTIVVPVIVTDVETPSDQLDVTVISSPPGATWDAATRVLTWTNAGPAGSYTFLVQVVDGVNKPLTAKYKIKLKAADTDPEKNKAPSPAKIKKPQALVGFEINLPILASDPDGDDLTISVDQSAYPFTAGATFDPGTNTFSWTPGFVDIGKVKIEFRIDDGTKAKKLKVKLIVINSLIS